MLRFIHDSGNESTRANVDVCWKTSERYSREYQSGTEGGADGGRDVGCNCDELSVVERPGRWHYVNEKPH